MPLTIDIAEQITTAYKRMAHEARYRPAAPSDGLGNITVPTAELDLDAEALEYAQHFAEEEDDDQFCTGCFHYPNRVAGVFAVEAVRMMCTGFGMEPIALKLLRMAVAELEQAGTNS